MGVERSLTWLKSIFWKELLVLNMSTLKMVNRKHVHFKTVISREKITILKSILNPRSYKIEILHINSKN
jgi:hypothetical protein